MWVGQLFNQLFGHIDPSSDTHTCWMENRRKRFSS
jgi:hypothetical protein